LPVVFIAFVAVLETLMMSKDIGRDLALYFFFGDLLQWAITLQTPGEKFTFYLYL
jgi:hypothetical protein